MDLLEQPAPPSAAFAEGARSRRDVRNVAGFRSKFQNTILRMKSVPAGQVT